MGSCSHRSNSSEGLPVSNMIIARRELEAAYLTERSMEVKVSQNMTYHLGGTKKDQDNLPGENYIS